MREPAEPTRVNYRDIAGVPPSFFADDCAKYEKRFESAVGQRTATKKKMNKLFDMSCRNIVNNNVMADSEHLDATNKMKDDKVYTGG